jgi:xylulokinase
LATHEPAAVAEAAALLLPKDALRALLVPDADPRTTDRSDASATLLWDVVADRWSSAAVRVSGIGEALLPAVRPATDVVGTARLPLGEVPVVVGAADTALALLAAGGRGDQVNLGTGAQVLRPGVRPEPADDPPVHTYADAGDGWYAMAALRNGGSAWAWVCRVLGLSWPELFDAAAAGAPGAGGVVFRPFLAGERSGTGAGERGSFRGLRPGTTREDLARAAVEGVLFAVAAAARLLPGSTSGDPVLLTGGGTRPAAVQQLLADLLDRPVRRLPLPSASAVGAAMLAARAVGLDVVPRQEAAPLVQPRPGSPVAAAFERWAEG